MLKNFFKTLSAIFIASIVCVLFVSITVSADSWSKEADGSTYYLTDSGEKLTGFQLIGENSYFFGEDGKMWTSKWLTTATGTKYYFKKDGTMATGKLKIGSKTYYFGKNGKMRTSKWVTTSSGAKYYFKKDGTMATGKLKIGGKTYEFAADGKLQVLSLWAPFDGISWGMSQEEIIKCLNLSEDQYFSDDDYMIVITYELTSDSDSTFLCDVYVTDDGELNAFGSLGVYSDETRKNLDDAFKNEGYFLAGSAKEDDSAYCYYVSKNNIGGIIYSDSFILYLIVSDTQTQSMIDSISNPV